MKKSIEKLFKKMGEDKAFAEKILLQSNKEELIKIAKIEGIDLTLEDIDEANEIIKKNLEQRDEGELSEEELENVAGGTWAVITVCSAAGVAGTAVTSAGVSATVTILSLSVAAVAGENQSNRQ